MKRIAILGSTGSIGKNTLDVVRHFHEDFKVAALSANSNIDILYQQIKLFRPEFVCVNDLAKALELKSRLRNNRLKFFIGQDGLLQIAEDKKIDKVVLAISGSAALPPLLKAIEAGKDIVLANKEALVMAGPLIMKRLKYKKARLMPVDSEQSAIWQCLQGQDETRLKNIYLTASGGPFRGISRDKLGRISLKEALKHPRWKMGRKISVDSATLMNKGLEVLEAMYLFGVEAGKIKIIIHPEAIIHSMVEFIDGVILAQLSVTDMRIPIQYALSYPERLENVCASVDFCKIKSFNFEKPDFDKFPCLGLAYSAARIGGTMPAVLNAANEISVNEFLKGRIDFIDIAKIIEKVLRKHRSIKSPSLADIFDADIWAREEAENIIK